MAYILAEAGVWGFRLPSHPLFLQKQTREHLKQKSSGIKSASKCNANIVACTPHG